MPTWAADSWVESCLSDWSTTRARESPSSMARWTVGRSRATRENSAATKSAVPAVSSTAPRTRSHSVTGEPPVRVREPGREGRSWCAHYMERGRGPAARTARARLRVDRVCRVVELGPSRRGPAALARAETEGARLVHGRPEFTGRIAVRGLTKRFGSFTAVDHLDFEVEPGRITGFLGPNGSGKTTTLRMLLGLVRATDGTATIDGHRYAEIPNPLTVVGSALEATNFHPGRTGRNHLRVQAAVAGRAGLARRRAARARRHPRRRTQAGGRLLDGHAPAARPRRRPARRPARHHPRRAGQRPRPRGHPLAARLPAPPRRRGPHAAHLQPHALRGRADGRRRRHHRQRPRVAQGTVAELRGEPTAYVRTSGPRPALRRRCAAAGSP